MPKRRESVEARPNAVAVVGAVRRNVRIVLGAARARSGRVNSVFEPV